MKHPLTTMLALAVLLAGCTTSPIATTPPPTTPAPAAPTTLAWKDIPVAPKKASAFEVILSDPKLLVLGPGDPWGPRTFAVFGDQALLEDSVGDGILTYTNGCRTGRGSLDTDDYVVVDDLWHATRTPSGAETPPQQGRLHGRVARRPAAADPCPLCARQHRPDHPQ